MTTTHVHRRPLAPHVMTYLVVIVPFVALLAAIPLAWGWGMSWLDVGLAVVLINVGIAHHIGPRAERR